MKISRSKTLPFAFLLIILTSCSDNDGCSEKEPEIYNLSPSDKKLITYSGKDTIKFLTETNETLSFIGQGRNSFTYTEQLGQGSCTYERHFEGEKIKYANLTNGDQIDIKYDSRRDVYIEFYNNLKDYGGDFNNPLVGFTPPPPFDFTDLNINNQLYSDVRRFYSTWNPNDTLLYSIQFGIIKVRLAPNKLFTRIP